MSTVDEQLVIVYNYYMRQSMCKYAVIGSRTFDDYNLLEETLSDLYITELISGGAKGADALAEQYANKNGLLCTVFHANWKEYGRAAGPIRNSEIINAADKIVAFWDGQSKGTADSIKKVQRTNKEITIVRI